MSDLTHAERLQAARNKFQQLKKRNEHLFQSNRTSSENATPSTTEADAVEVAELKSIIEQQKATIKKLRNENTDLKLERMDLADKVTNLEQQLAQSSLPVPVQTASQHTPKQVTHSPKKDPRETPVHSQISSADVKENIIRWKNWNVDMRDWNGSKYTQVVL